MWADQAKRVVARTSASVSVDHRCRHRDTSGCDDLAQTACVTFSWCMHGVHFGSGIAQHAQYSCARMQNIASIIVSQLYLAPNFDPRGVGRVGGWPEQTVGSSDMVAHIRNPCRRCVHCQIFRRTQLSGHTGGSGLRAVAVVGTLLVAKQSRATPPLAVVPHMIAAGLHSPRGRAGAGIVQRSQQEGAPLIAACICSARACCPASLSCAASTPTDER